MISGTEARPEESAGLSLGPDGPSPELKREIKKAAAYTHRLYPPMVELSPEDLEQEINLRLVKAQYSSICRALLYLIAKNAVIDARRKNKFRMPDLPLPDDAGDRLPESASMLDIVIVELFADLPRILDRDELQSFELVLLNKGMTQRQLARTLGISESVVSEQFTKIESIVRSLLSDFDPDDGGGGGMKRSVKKNGAMATASPLARAVLSRHAKASVGSSGLEALLLRTIRRDQAADFLRAVLSLPAFCEPEPPRFGSLEEILDWLGAKPQSKAFSAVDPPAGASSSSNESAPPQNTCVFRYFPSDGCSGDERGRRNEINLRDIIAFATEEAEAHVRRAWAARFVLRCYSGLARGLEVADAADAARFGEPWVFFGRNVHLCSPEAAPASGLAGSDGTRSRVLVLPTSITVHLNLVTAREPLIGQAIGLVTTHVCNLDQEVGLCRGCKWLVQLSPRAVPVWPGIHGEQEEHSASGCDFWNARYHRDAGDNARSICSGGTTVTVPCEQEVARPLQRFHQFLNLDLVEVLPHQEVCDELDNDTILAICRRLSISGTNRMADGTGASLGYTSDEEVLLDQESPEGSGFAKLRHVVQVRYDGVNLIRDTFLRLLVAGALPPCFAVLAAESLENILRLGLARCDQGTPRTALRKLLDHRAGSQVAFSSGSSGDPMEHRFFTTTSYPVFARSGSAGGIHRAATDIGVLDFTLSVTATRTTPCAIHLRSINDTARIQVYIGLETYAGETLRASTEWLLKHLVLIDGAGPIEILGVKEATIQYVDQRGAECTDPHPRFRLYFRKLKCNSDSDNESGEGLIRSTEVKEDLVN